MTAATMRFYSTAVGKKAVMAVTGLLLVLFVVVHLLGNLQVYGGPARMNAYAAFLRSIPGPLWALRIVILLAAVLHVVTAIQLILQNLFGRSASYVKRHYVAATTASRTMLVTGPLLLCYVVYHLLHQTFGTLLPGFSHIDVYRNVVIGFSSPPATVIYVAAMVALGFHLKHGSWSLLQSLGLNIPKCDGLIRGVAMVLAVIVTLGFISIPVAALTGLIR